MFATHPQRSESATLLATFFLRDSLFALDASTVQEVIRLGAVTVVSHGPPEVVGVINLRGKIVTLLDTGLILGLAAAGRARESRVFLIEDRGEFLGLLVDRVGEMIEPGSSEPLPLNIPAAQARFFLWSLPLRRPRDYLTQYGGDSVRSASITEPEGPILMNFRPKEPSIEESGCRSFLELVNRSRGT